MVIDQLLREATAQLAATSRTPRLDAELLLAHVLNWPRARLIAERSYQPSMAQQSLFVRALARRAALEPVAYIVGHKEFYGLTLEVTAATLVPRPETELLVSLCLAQAATYAVRPAPLRIADIGTGSGALALALATHMPHALLYATDVSAAALEVAARNVARYGLSERIHLLQGDLLAPLPEAVDLIVSNPPYTILAEVEANVLAHEPHLALDGGPDGADLYRRIIPDLGAYLRPGGAVLFEIGAWQGQIVRSLVQQHYPQALINIQRDLAGHERVVIVTKL
ncbi:peptide chain release factor N(5)-glutamine methyltransferase [Candidatus Viridilinea mediisalina]|uniref:Release factor glutamine methyltransferase n=1 Tax=Candidatus Viridilinea mediisalina TaxID=2024553 RepID=A0A2A6RMQ8_9CHLR|nr:peptide chain release factor N(5)-glutamine methyltransferase [Candidatus Viridilinea mediisalina]PDW04168.1 protein-(glutamine-N5) methyltransferase, release factor-specific [Candidatus Viridilinea mediisalina]